MTQSLFAHGDREVSGHILVMGTTGQGYSRRLAAEAERLGLTYESLMLRMEPTPEQKAQTRALAEERRRQEAARLAAVCQAYWDATADPAAEFSRVADALFPVTGRALSLEQLHRIVLMLPADIIGTGIAWGFSDTEVGDAVARFAEEHQDAIRNALA